MQTFVIYSRQGCHLCEVLIEDLLPLLRGRAQFEVRDIDSRPDWLERYDIRVPVVELDGECLSQYQLDRPAIEKAIAKSST